MSVLDRLRELVSGIESEQATSTSEDSLLPSIESEEKQEKGAEQETPDYVKCTKDETVLVLSYRENAKQARLSLSTLLIQFEKDKQQLLSIIKKQENMFFQSLNDLRGKKGVPEDGYSASVPETSAAVIIFEKE